MKLLLTAFVLAFMPVSAMAQEDLAPLPASAEIDTLVKCAAVANMNVTIAKRTPEDTAGLEAARAKHGAVTRKWALLMRDMGYDPKPYIQEWVRRTMVHWDVYYKDVPLLRRDETFCVRGGYLDA